MYQRVKRASAWYVKGKGYIDALLSETEQAESRQALWACPSLRTALPGRCLISRNECLTKKFKSLCFNTSRKRYNGTATRPPRTTYGRPSHPKRTKTTSPTHLTRHRSKRLQSAGLNPAWARLGPAIPFKKRLHQPISRLCHAGSFFCTTSARRIQILPTLMPQG